MHTKLLDVLACPRCSGSLTCKATETDLRGHVARGTLECTQCRAAFPVHDGIPRFVATSKYAASFGYQWNRFRKEQIDSFNGTDLSQKRFSSETGWSLEEMEGQWVLDAGCGAGRFLDVASKADCDVVGIDLSTAVDAAQANLSGRTNVHLVQASIYELPFRPGAFDACYCIGVVQHTPDPHAALRALPKVLRQGGQLAITAYELRRWTPLYSKYLVRRLTRRLSDRTLLRALKVLMPILFPITELLFRVPMAGKYFAFLIPVANYVNERGCTWRQRYQLAILDTFDMLSPDFDQPQTQLELVDVLSSEGIEGITRLSNPGLNVVGRKGRPAQVRR